MKSKQSNSNRVLIIIIVLLFIVSSSLFIYPFISKTSEKFENTKAYENFITKKEDPKESPLYIQSLKYNETLIGNQNFNAPFTSSAIDLGEYDINDDIYGYLSIDSIDLTLPIYLGASESNLEKGCAHLYGTSLPIKTNPSASVLCAHTGFIGKTFFDDLPKLDIGDTIHITTTFDEYTYNVKESKEISKYVFDEMYIKSDSSSLILLTCADFGQNRFIVICD